jgi:hypothetical protein
MFGLLAVTRGWFYAAPGYLQAGLVLARIILRISGAMPQREKPTSP